MYWIIQWIEQWLHRLYNKLNLKYSAPRIYLQPLQTPTQSNKSISQYWQPTQLLMPRARCLYRFFPLGDIPANNINQVLQLKIKQWSPWVDTGEWRSFSRLGVMVWIWEQMPSEQTLGLHIIPETLLQESDTEGIYVKACLQGYDIQYWQHAVLLHSLWLSKPPSDLFLAQWLELLGLNTKSTVAYQPIIEPLQPIPWKFNQTQSRQANAATLKLVLVLGLWMVAALYVYWSVDTFRWYRENQTVEQQYERLLVSARPIIDMRNKLVQSEQVLQTLSTLAPAQWQAKLFAAVLPALEAAQCKPCSLISWQYDGLILEFVVESNPLDQKILAERLYKTPLFDKVSIIPRVDKKTWTIQAELKVDKAK